MGCCLSSAKKPSERPKNDQKRFAYGPSGKPHDKHARNISMVLNPDSRSLPIEKLKAEKSREKIRKVNVKGELKSEHSDEKNAQGNGEKAQVPKRHMQRQMAEMDRMMTDPFGMMDRMMGGMMGHGHPMLQNGNPQSRQRAQPSNAMDVFGGFGGFGFGGGLMRMMDHAMDDPNSMVFSQSTCITMGPDGKQRVVQNSTRKAGDVKETRRAVHDGGEERVSIGHHIGDRAHVIEKKRDREGRVRQNQKFMNLEEDEAETFNQEFKNRATRNLAFDPFARNTTDRRAIEDSRGPRQSRHRRELGEGTSGSSAPIIEIPDDDDDEQERRQNSRRNQQGGPIIRELSDEEAEMESSKRRRGMFGNVFRH